MALLLLLLLLLPSWGPLPWWATPRASRAPRVCTILTILRALERSARVRRTAGRPLVVRPRPRVHRGDGHLAAFAAGDGRRLRVESSSSSGAQLYGTAADVALLLLLPPPRSPDHPTLSCRTPCPGPRARRLPILTVPARRRRRRSAAPREAQEAFSGIAPCSCLLGRARTNARADVRSKAKERARPCPRRCTIGLKTA